MAVYVLLSEGELARVADAFGLGPLRSAAAVPEGSINTNYRIETLRGRFFLRHTRVRSPADLEFEAALLEHLQAARFPAPHLIKTTSGESFLHLESGRVSIFRFLAGEERTRVDLTEDHCGALGREVGKLHRLAQSFQGERHNPYGPEIVARWLDELRRHPDREMSALGVELARDLEEVRELPLAMRGAIHADLFMDNVKWVGDQVSALFDFEMACVDAYVLDLAIALNAWCFDRGYQEGHARALVRGYQEERPLSGEELGLFHRAARFGAIRYTASRIRDFHLSPLPPERLARKDFRTYLHRVRVLRDMGEHGWRALLWL